MEDKPHDEVSITTLKQCSNCERPTNSLRKGRCPGCYYWYRTYGEERPEELKHRHLGMRGENNHNWKGRNVDKNTARKRARALYKLDGETCEWCNQFPAIDRHHKNGDVYDNNPDNILLVCKSCHVLLEPTTILHKLVVEMPDVTIREALKYIETMMKEEVKNGRKAVA